MKSKKLNKAKQRVHEEEGYKLIRMLEWLHEEPGDNTLTPHDVMTLIALMLKDSGMTKGEAVFEAICDEGDAKRSITRIENMLRSYKAADEEASSRIRAALDWIQSATDEEYQEHIREYYNRFRFEFSDDEWRKNHPELFEQEAHAIG